MISYFITTSEGFKYELEFLCKWNCLSRTTFNSKFVFVNIRDDEGSGYGEEKNITGEKIRGAIRFVTILTQIVGSSSQT